MRRLRKYGDVFFGFFIDGLLFVVGYVVLGGFLCLSFFWGYICLDSLYWCRVSWGCVDLVCRVLYDVL